MQKNLLQPLPASASPFCFSASFSSSLFFSSQRTPFSSSLFFPSQRAISPSFFPAPYFSFLQMCCPFSAQVLSPKRFSVQPNTFLFFFSVLFSALIFLFQFSASFCCFCSAPLSLVFSASLLLFCRHVALLSSAFYFSAQNRFEPKAQNVLLLQFNSFSFPSAPAFLFSFLPTSKAKNILSR